ncbi:MAG: hypothetical protein MUE70_10320 [Desulfobacterales bacterium]|nr:hypothetical protein [Desulfobacterales bacterium]
MADLSISRQAQGIVVFRLWKTLPYPVRILLSFGLIIAGFFAQFFTLDFCPGCVGVLLGNLLLIVKGYDNRVKPAKFSPEASWEKVSQNKFTEVERLHRDMKKWDRSLLDITSGPGFMALMVLSAVIGVFYYTASSIYNSSLMIITYDAALLLLPHWVTGVRTTLTKPNMILKISKFKKLMKNNDGILSGHDIDYYMLLAGDEGKIPDDVKVRINLKHHHKDFLGLYGQMVTNEVNGTSYPYFYVVLVAKKGFGLEKAFNSFSPPAKITKEFKIEGDVEVFVIRQATTETSGYHTSDRQMSSILASGVALAEKYAVTNQ